MNTAKRSVLDDPDIPAPLRQDHITAEIIREHLWRPPNRRNDWRVFAVVGREGSGKSLTCASILKAADPTFGVDRTHFEPVPFLEDVGYETDDVGRAVMGDEVGVAFGKRTWHDREQIESNQYLQTARDDNRIIGLTAPRLEEIDSQLQGRLHVLIETEKKKDGDWVEVRWKKLDPSRAGQNKIYQHYPRKVINNRTVKVTRLKIGPPPSEYIPEYEKKKKAWKSGLKDRVVSNYAEDESGPDKSKAPREIADEILDGDAEQYIDVHGGNGRRYISWELIKSDFGVSRHDAKTVQKLLKKDGVLEE